MSPMHQSHPLIQQPRPCQHIHRPPPILRLTSHQLRPLLTRMNMHHPPPPLPPDHPQPITPHRPNTMRRHPHPHPLIPHPNLLQPLHTRQHCLHIPIHKPPLQRIRPLAKPRPLISHPQQNNANPHPPRRSNHPMSQLIPIAIRRAITPMMQVMKLPHRRDPRRRHLQKSHCRNCLDVIRAQAIRRPIHRRPPAPKVIILPPRRQMLRPPPQHPLKRMGMRIDQTRHQRRHAMIHHLHPLPYPRRSHRIRRSHLPHRSHPHDPPPRDPHHPTLNHPRRRQDKPRPMLDHPDTRPATHARFPSKTTPNSTTRPAPRARSSSAYRRAAS